ncbi:MAG: TPR end-of-group domain-containing protein [Planctomycetota bacterium]|jgi:hypothetical protein
MDKLARLGYPAVLAAVLLAGLAAWSDPGPFETRGPRALGREAVELYNTACAESLRGNADRAATNLLRAVKAGFNDFSHMRRDPDLRGLRQHPVFQAIVDARDAADELLARRRHQEWRQRLDPGRYRFETDEEHNLSYATALDKAAHRDMRRMLADLSAHLDQALFRTSSADVPTRCRVIIVIPADGDAARLLTEPNAAGVYYHHRRELIATDPQRALRHEFVHLMHHRHMDAVGQQHAAWIQEGLAAVYEEYRLEPDGGVHFAPNDREPLARMLARTGRLISWRDLAAMGPDALRADAARAYPQLRSMFRYIAEREHLAAWYETYVDSFDNDPTGVTALEVALGRPVDELEQQWRRWLERQPHDGGGHGAADDREVRPDPDQG